MEATATETAGLRCPPDTPPLTKIPRRTPRPQLVEVVLVSALSVPVLSPYPQFIVKKFPFVLRERTDWPIDAVPTNTSTKVPEILLTFYEEKLIFVKPRNSARNSRTTVLRILQLQPPPPPAFLPILLTLNYN